MTSSPALSIVPAPIPNPNRAEWAEREYAGIIFRYRAYQRAGGFDHWFYPEAIGSKAKECKRSLKKAEKRMKSWAIDFANGQLSKAAITDAEWQQWLDANKIAARLGKTILHLLQEREEQQRRVPEGWTHGRIFDNGVAQLPARTVSKNIPALVDEFLSDIEPRVSAKHFKNVERRLTKFAASFTGPASEITSAPINVWMRSLSVGPYTKKHIRSDLLQFFNWSKSNGYLRRDWDEIKDVVKHEPKDAPTIILLPNQMQKLLEVAQSSEAKGHTRHSIIPLIVLGGFGGLRHEEIIRLDWRDIDLEKRQIYVRRDVAKTGNDRLVPIADNLRAWLRLYFRTSGAVITAKNTSNALTRLKKRAGIPAGKKETRNALRHSFCSYRLPQVGINQVAEEAGNTPGMIRKHYKRPVADSDVRAWFSIGPKQAQLRLRGL